MIAMVLVSTVAYGQTESAVYKKYLSKKKYAEGFVLLKDSTKVNGAIKSPSGMLGTISMITKDGEKRSFTFNEMLAYKKGSRYFETDGLMFYELIKRGKNVSYYERIVTTSMPAGNGMMMTSSQTLKYFRKKGSMYFEKVGGLNFAKDMARYFSDCPELVTKIEKKQFSYSDPELLISYYDRCSISDSKGVVGSN